MQNRIIIYCFVCCFLTAQTLFGDYVQNTNTKRYHHPDCYAVKLIHPENYQEVQHPTSGYVPCKKCRPTGSNSTESNPSIPPTKNEQKPPQESNILSTSQDSQYGEQKIERIDIIGIIFNEMSSSNLYDAIGNYAGSDGGKLAEAIGELDPTALSLENVLIQDTVSQFSRSLFSRLDERRNNRSNAFTSNNEQDRSVLLNQCGTDTSQTRELWFQNVGQFIDQETRGGINGYEANTYGFGVGGDRYLTQYTTIGTAFGGTFSDANMKNVLGSTEVDNYLFSLYGSYSESQWTINAVAGYAVSTLESKRYAPLINGYAQSERNADTWFGSFDISRRFEFNNKYRYLTPFYRMDIVGLNEEGYTESGDLINLHVASQSTGGYLQTIGARLGGHYKSAHGWILNPEVTLGWVHNYGDGNVITMGQFVQGGSLFTVLGVSRNNDRALVGFGLNTDISQRLNVYARYDGEHANRFTNQAYQFGFTLSY